ncbi:hypothetical protein [Escherichia phage vB_EcoM_APEC]|nr:hypothetical protein [Escherichia phage vB_EcoM_APEC]
MSRLQVGGLALHLKSGLTCKLLAFYGDGYTRSGYLKKENWRCDFGEKVQCENTGVWGQVMFEEAKYLLPLGDKQTQDELAKEKELEDA